MSNYILDLTSKRITFLDNRFYLHENGNYYPSVTTILDAYPKGPEYFAWLKRVGEDSDEIRDEAGRRGSTVHNFTEKFDRGEEVNLMNDNGDIGCKLIEWKMFERYVEFRKRFEVDIKHIELNLVSPALGFAGTLDRNWILKDDNMIIDIKTSNAIYPSYWLQLAAYKRLAFLESGIDSKTVGILWLNAKTKTLGKPGSIQGEGYQLLTRSEEEGEKDWQLFKATQQLWLAENGSLQPKKLSYSLTHKL